jgi:hypothetical protein
MDSSKFASGILLLAGVGFLCDTCFAFETALEKTKLDGHDTQDIDILIEQRLSYIHAKIDLTPTIDGLRILEKSIYRLDKGTADNLSIVLTRGLRKRLDRIETKLVRVSGKRYLNDKTKRSIEFVGDLISDLFGNPGPSDWKKNAANVLALQSALKRLNDNTGIDHADIDINRHNIERNNNEIRSLVTAVSKNQIILASVSDELVSLKVYFEISYLADAIENQVDYLVEVKSDSLKGFCNDRALDKDFLVENLLNLEANKVGLSPIFSNWEWRAYYKYDMCSVAMENNAVWITLRIPLVKKSERLVRVIPTPALHETLVKVESYGLDVVLFRERDNDKFHVMTKSALEFCTNLGKKLSCSVRDVRFGLSSAVVIPVEFALNRFLLVSNTPQSIKLMGRCPMGMTEHTVETDAVLLVPVNCSYIGKSIIFDTRESDTSVTREIGIVHFEKLEINNVRNLHFNLSTATIAMISNKTNDLNFARNKRIIDEQLEKIDTKHDDLWARYSTEKWSMLGGLCAAVLLELNIKTYCYCRKKRQTTTKTNVSKDKTDKSEQQQQPQKQQTPLTQQQQTQQIQLNVLRDGSCADHVYTEVCDRDETSFCLPPEHSQFYEPCAKKQ